MEELKISESTKVVSKLLGSRTFFPIEIQSEPNELIRFTKRPRRTDTEIVDIFSKDVHIGMFIGLIRTPTKLLFGQYTLNASHDFRDILKFGFAKLLEYYGLEGIEAIEIEVTDKIALQEYLTSLGFVQMDKIMFKKLDDSNRVEFARTIEENYPTILDREGQIQNLIRRNMTNPDDKTVRSASKRIIQKVKYRERLGEEFWDYRSIVKLKNYLNTALSLNKSEVYNDYLNVQTIFEGELIGEEFLNFFIRTLINSFRPYIRKAYLEEFFSAMDGERDFPIPYVQELIEKLKLLMDPKDIDRVKYRKWLKDNMPHWKMRAEIAGMKEDELTEKSILSPEDFAPNIDDRFQAMVNSLVDHYNNNKVFFGLKTSFQENP